MLRVALVNMPFASWARPSFALSQISAYVTREFGDEVSVDIVNLTLPFAEYFTPDTYDAISENLEHLNTGLGDWLFRDLAFPESGDNSEEYLKRFYPGARWTGLRSEVMRRRDGLGACLDAVIERHGLADGYDVVGFTSMFAQHVPCIAAGRAIKKRSPGTLVIIGGANCESPMGNVLAEQVPEFDFVFSGPSLLSFSAFLRCVIEGRPEAADAITGVLSNRNVGLPGKLLAAGPDNDIDDYVSPRYGDYFESLAQYPGLESRSADRVTLFFETSRGCWWGERSHCTFCGLNGQSMGYRAMNPSIAVRQFGEMFEYAHRCTTYYCTDNVMPRNYPRDVFPQLTTPETVRVFYEIKLPVSRRDLAAMARAGVTLVQPGIEALATSTLQLMAKGTTSFQNIQFLKNCREFGIEPVWNLLIGFPKESPSVYEKYLRDMPLLTHLPPPQGVYLVRFDRYSPYFNQRLDYGLDLKPMDYYPLIYPFGDAKLDQLAYFFSDSSLGSYALDAYEWHGPLQAAVADWLSGWPEGEAPRRDLRLERDERGWVARDSRYAEVREHVVPDEAVALLQRLESPATTTQLERDWPGDPATLRTNLALLDELGLLFEEDGKLLSVVRLSLSPDPVAEVAR